VPSCAPWNCAYRGLNLPAHTAHTGEPTSRPYGATPLSRFVGDEIGLRRLILS
jgi:hypothetical protein